MTSMVGGAGGASFERRVRPAGLSDAVASALVA
jgi:hypothetical protein